MINTLTEHIYWSSLVIFSVYFSYLLFPFDISLTLNVLNYSFRCICALTILFDSFFYPIQIPPMLNIRKKKNVLVTTIVLNSAEVEMKTWWLWNCILRHVNDAETRLYEVRKNRSDSHSDGPDRNKSLHQIQLSRIVLIFVIIPR